MYARSREIAIEKGRMLKDRIVCERENERESEIECE